MSDATCSVDDPEGHSPGGLRKGLCTRHYYRMKAHGSTDKPASREYERVPIEDRFWPKVDKDYNEWGCWFWKAGGSNSYGRIGGYGDDGEPFSFQAHQLSWQWDAGQQVPKGLVLDHFLYPGRCIGPRCVNPSHLRPTTIARNAMRSPLGNAAKTHCPKGHPYDLVRESKWGKKRDCSKCLTERNRAAYVRRRKREGKWLGE